MSPKIDPAILQALSLSPAATTLTSHGGSGFSSTYKLTSKGSDGEEKVYFVKTGGVGSELMFAGEHTSLTALHTAIPTLCPQSYAHGPLLSSPGSFLATDFLHLSSPSPQSKPGSGVPLAHKLAKLHSTPAPVPDGYDKPQFGFPVPTCCGETVQDNSYEESWAEFYAERRLGHILKCAEKTQGKDPELSQLANTTIRTIVPRLLRDGHLTSPDGSPIRPVIVHGDLWSGNRGTGRIGDGGGVEEVVFDPSSSYAHSEYEFGIMGMFGGFGAAFNAAYWEIKPRDHPVEEWEDRRLLYELYHHLNHYAMFGGGYRGGAVRIMQRLIRKYGGGDADGD